MKLLRVASLVSLSLSASLSLIPGRMWAQTFRTLYSFTAGTDGAFPYAGLILSGDTLYGTASMGGSYAQGTVFKLVPSTGTLTTLVSFIGGNGGNPASSLIMDADGNLVFDSPVPCGSRRNRVTCVRCLRRPSSSQTKELFP